MNKVSIWCSAILCFAFVAPTTASANIIARTQISSDFDGRFDQQILTSGTAQAASFLLFEVPMDVERFEAKGTASASLGTLKGFSLVDNGSPLFVIAQTLSSFEDVLSIVLRDDSNISLAPGTPGFADIRVAYNWSVLPPSNGGANAFITLDVPGGRADASEGPFVTTPLTVSGSTQAIDSVLGEFFTVRVPFASGDDLAISLSLITDALTDGPAFARSDASHSAYWGGIVAVRDSDLNIMPFSVTSASGTDYRGSFVPGEEVPTVPEPATLSMLCCGFLFLLNRRVRRGRRLLLS